MATVICSLLIKKSNTSLGTLILLIGCAGTTWITSPFETFSCRVVTERTRFRILQGKRQLHAPILSSSGIGDERNETEGVIKTYFHDVRRFYAYIFLFLLVI